MANIPAITIEKALGSMSSDDGAFGLLNLKSSQGDLWLAVPFEEIPGLISTASSAAGACMKIRAQDSNQKAIFDVEWWEFRLTQDLQNLILSFRLPGGAELSFQVHRDRLPQMRETLETIEGRSQIPPSHQTSKH